MACEKCWKDASFVAYYLGTSVADEYEKLLAERAGNPCTPAEQCGEMHSTFLQEDGSYKCRCGKVMVPK